MQRCIAPALALLLASSPVLAKDDLLEVLAQKGVLTADEYEKLKAQRRSEVTLNADDGFKLVSADGSASLMLGTLQQLDVLIFHDDLSDLPDGTELRRSRLSVAGTYARDFQYRVEYEFSSTASSGVLDASVNYSGMKAMTVTLGQFKQPIGMDQLAADKNLSFMERALPFALVPGRATGLMLSSAGARWSVAGGLFGESVSTATTAGNDEGYGLAMRGTFAPVLDSSKLIHLGVSALLRHPTADSVTFATKPESNLGNLAWMTTGALTLVDEHRLEGLELAGRLGPASLQGEYHAVQVSRHNAGVLNFGGWYGQLAYTLTGEARPYKAERGIFDGIRPAKSFGSQGWGAFEVAARVSGIELADDTVNGGRERNAALALNWYLNPFMRASANVVRVLSVEGGAQAGNTPTAFQMRFQLAL